MKYLRRFKINEVLIEYDDRKIFINEIVSIFTNEVIDNFDYLEELDERVNINRFYTGIHYQYVEIYLALDLENPYFSIEIHTCTPDLFEEIIPFLSNFYEKLNTLRFKVEVGQERIISSDEFLKKLWNHLNYIEDSWSVVEPFEIKILY